jgi:hypothetical protein
MGLADSLRNMFGGQQPGPFTPGPGPFQPLPSDVNNRYVDPVTRGGNTIYGLLGGAAKTYMTAAAFLPSVDEALSTQQIVSRMRFYQPGITTSPGGISAANASNYSMMNKTMRIGTPMTPGDILSAINAAQASGIGPGLSNFAPGAGSTPFAGILGGAALASNLTPGIGLTGGVGVMAGLNKAPTVNLLRMLGVQVRSGDGTSMQDLPTIIEQLYSLLTRNNGSINAQDLAVSLMPGNALDSMLTQIAGNDMNMRSVLTSGLIQRVKTGSPLNATGNKKSMIDTGGSVELIRSSALRNYSEQAMIEKYTDVTAGASVGANNFLQSIYGMLAKDATSNIMNPAAQIGTALTQFSGARGGAGGLALYDMLGKAGSIGGWLGTKELRNSGAWDNLSDKKKAKAWGQGEYKGQWAGGLTALALGGYVGGIGKTPDRMLASGVESVPYASANSPASAASTVGPQFTGAITINVSAPPGADPYAYSSAFLDAFR